jgi:preprotein translocase subunit SecD
MQSLKIALGFLSLSLSLTGCALFPKDEPKTSLHIHEQVSSALPPQNAMPIEIPSADLKLSVSLFPILTEKNILSAELYNTAGGAAIFVRFDIHGTVVLDEATTRNRGLYLVTFLNNHPVAAWLVNQRILNGQFLVEGDFTDEEAKKAVDDLNKMGKANR